MKAPPTKHKYLPDIKPSQKSNEKSEEHPCIEVRKRKQLFGIAISQNDLCIHSGVFASLNSSTLIRIFLN